MSYNYRNKPNGRSKSKNGAKAPKSGRPPAGQYSSANKTFRDRNDRGSQSSSLSSSTATARHLEEMHGGGQARRGLTQPQQRQHGLAGSSIVGRDEKAELLNSLRRSLGGYLNAIQRQTGYPLVWLKMSGIWRAAFRVATASNEETALIKIGESYRILERRYVEERFPDRDMTQQDLLSVIERLSELEQFETIATVKYRTAINTWNPLATTRYRIEERDELVTTFVVGTDRVGVTLADGSSHNIPTSGLKSRPLRGLVSNQAEVISQLQGQIEQFQAEIATIASRLEDTENELGLTKNELDAAKQQHNRHREEWANKKRNAENKYSRCQSQVREKEREITSLKAKESSNRGEIRRLQRVQQENEAQMQQQRERIDNQEKTIAERDATLRNLRNENHTLKGDLSEQYAMVSLLEKNAEIHAYHEEQLTREKEETERLRGVIKEKEDTLSLYRPNSILSVYSSVNFGKELSDLQMQKYDDAEEICSEIAGLTTEQCLDVLWRIFMFSYDFFEDRMADFRHKLKLDADERLETRFIVSLQDHYLDIYDGDGLVQEYLNRFSGELGDVVDNRKMLGYVHACGKLCWSVVIHLPKLHFLPRTNDIDLSEPIPFDSTKFRAVSGSIGRGQSALVTGYILPGLYRIDSEDAIGANALPLVAIKKVKRASQVPRVYSSTKPVANDSYKAKAGRGPSVRATKVSATFGPSVDLAVGHKTTMVSRIVDRRLVEAAENEIWEGNVSQAREKLMASGINFSQIKIGCADCDAVVFENFREFADKFTEDQGAIVECPQDDTHLRIRVITKRR